MELTGIEIKVGKTVKFIGKVGIAPVYSLPDQIGRPVIFYREAKYTDVYSFETGAIGVDVAALDYAIELGAAVMVNWLTDEMILIGALVGSIVGSPIINLGERAQYRLPVDQWRTLTGYGRVKLGHTNNVINVDQLFFERAQANPRIVEYFDHDDPNDELQMRLGI